MHNKIVFLSLIIILGLINWSIIGKEEHLNEGKIVYLELAPVDPRSLMQGDYMVLRFGIANDVNRALHKIKKQQWHYNMDTADGYVVVSFNEKKIGSFNRIFNDGILSDDELLMHYRIRNGVVKFATNAFFFQEGHRKIYQSARYGQFRVDDKGELLLAGLFDIKLHKLEPKEMEDNSN